MTIRYSIVSQVSQKRHSITKSEAFSCDFTPYVKVAHVVNLKLVFTDQFFYNLIVLIK